MLKKSITLGYYDRKNVFLFEQFSCFTSKIRILQVMYKHFSLIELYHEIIIDQVSIIYACQKRNLKPKLSILIMLLKIFSSAAQQKFVQNFIF